ncbi:MAG: toxin-antitoxin system HicB family antitoxin [Planctomycetaceae bacterium]|nr:toxin-antitoxin system HicB family antitoxin [Planctomycetaceae bacterium]
MSNESLNPATNSPMPFETRCHRVLQFARDLYRQSPDWVKFFREVVGVDGAARKVFTTQDEFIAFERSDAFHTIKRMVNALRNNKSTSHSDEEDTRVITVRLPESVHEALKAEADDHGTSMNKLCISKLLQVLDEDESGQRARTANRVAPRSDAQPQTARPMAPNPAFVATNSVPVGPVAAKPEIQNVAPSMASTTPPYRPNFT